MSGFTTLVKVLLLSEYYMTLTGLTLQQYTA